MDDIDAPIPPQRHASPSGVDGAADRVRRPPRKSTTAIFIHAGAGFHSHQNERMHLEACSDAAVMGMRFLKAGATATEAVEAALRILEDKEITNAGFGSNLAIDGTVECDATIVDHLGRSGACGAVPNVRNPISLAKLILDKSNIPLTLRRVPPNILIGHGAKSFANKHGMVVMANEFLVSKNARDRFLRWQDDLRRAEEKLRSDQSRRSIRGSDQGCTNVIGCQYDTFPPQEQDRSRLGNNLQRDHANAILTGTWNEGQTDSPYHGSPAPSVRSESPSQSYFAKNAVPQAGQSTLPGQSIAQSRSPLGLMHIPRHSRRSPSPKRTRREGRSSGLHKSDRMSDDQPVPLHEGHRDGSTSPARFPIAATAVDHFLGTTQHVLSPQPRGIKRPFAPGPAQDEDIISDTIGAIAIDERGRVAAGSSSGGIGMKHPGRLGPAALVNIGTAVIPSPEAMEDSCGDGPTVATVTSGTGEHMATTMASWRCAHRIFSNTRLGPEGVDVEEHDEDVIMQSFIDNDFMQHPGVKNCSSIGAIGVMAVKKTTSGFYLYFAHNTDSFALASMASTDVEPHCVMSRLGESCKVARGARKIRVE